MSLVGIETDRGPWVQALIAAGYAVFAINPVQAARYRERHSASGAKSDPGDAHVLAEVVRLDRDHHRPVAGDSAIGQEVRMLARSHQSLIWSRQRHANQLRSLLREYYPGALAAFGDDLVGRDALAVLVVAPTPAAGPEADREADRGGAAQGRPAALPDRHRAAHPRRARRAAAGHAGRTRARLRRQRPIPDPGDHHDGRGRSRSSQGEVEAVFRCHPDAEILLSQPGLGVVLGGPGARRVRRRPRPLRRRTARKNYSGMSPDHPGLRNQARRPGPLRPQQATRRRPRSAGLRRPEQLPRSPRLLRHPPSQRRRPPPRRCAP